MVIVVNGEEKQLGEAVTLAELVESFTAPGQRVAIELNREVIRRSEWGERLVNDADRIEIVHFVGGG